ncbi:HutD/Ves family protein [Acidovorax sp. RAC01]|uniref:HutD/Ves family protein n=1 Tax=Acidovorax sp. RAC01 TaxID=1842533 RepID=UPI00083E76E1|nr:HutD family protein [Acidovorax sp. RAC01]AOG25145.1 hutD family protein [Acidovorax sp. RAC01]
MNFFDLATTPSTPWKNGGGSTQELACWPPGADMNRFEWRVSLATVDRPGPFSVFPGIDRQIMLLGGDGLHLRSPAWEHRLEPRWQPFSFSGDDAVDGAMLGGTSKDFNLMLRRGVWRGALNVVSEAQGPVAGEAGLAMVLEGEWLWSVPGAAPQRLCAGQGVWWAEGSTALGVQLAPAATGTQAAAARAVWIALDRAADANFA